MGLTIHADQHRASWSYSGFHDFREAVARAANIPLGYMEGYYGGYGRAKQSPTIPFAPFPWAPYERDTVTILLNHSDSEGEIAPAQCALLAERLVKILLDLPEYHQIRCAEFITVLIEANALNIPAIFA